MNSIEEETYHELSSNLKNLLPEKISNDEFDEVMKYFMQIVKQESKILINQYQRHNRFYPQPYSSTNLQTPTINLYILSQPQNYSNFQPPPQLNYSNIQPQPQNYSNFQQPQSINFSQTNPFANFLNAHSISSLPTFEEKRKKKADKKHKKEKGHKKHEKDKKKKKEKAKKQTNDKEKEFKHQEGLEFNGIMKYLIDKTGSNISENGTIEIKTNSVQHPYFTKYLVDYNSNDHYCTKYGIENAYVCFDFKERRINLTSYTLQSFYENNCLKNWVLEVSNNESEWIEVDRRVEDSSIHGKFITSTYNVLKKDDYYRFIRLRQTGRNWIGDLCTNINKIEFYGKLKE